MIYFDNSATTKPYPEVREIVLKTMEADFGNPSSMHMAGVTAEHYVKDARAKIVKTLRAREKEIYFTSGGTESNNWAVLMGAEAGKRIGNRIITSAMEHPSVSEPMKALAAKGFEVISIGTDRDGRLDMEALEKALNEETILVSVMLVNNEIGAVTDALKISSLIRSKAPKALYHADAVQAYGKYEIAPHRLGIDLLSISGHKIHGPKGVGVLYISENVHFLPMILGGGQQGGLRSGTDNVPGIAGIGEAARLSYERLAKNREILYGLTDYLRSSLTELDRELREGAGDKGTSPWIVLHGRAGEESAPHIVHASFPGIGSEVLLHALEDREICVSAGSACSSHKKAKSPTMEAIGASEEEKASGIRFSFSEENTKEEIDILLAALKDDIPVLRRYRAR